MPRAPRSSKSPTPSAADLAAGIVGPMDIPITSPMPILRLKTREFRRQKAKNYSLQRFYKKIALEGRKPHENSRLRKLQRLRSSIGLPVTTITEDLQNMDEEFHVSKNRSIYCQCNTCIYLRRWSSTLQPYRCKNINCGIPFDSFTDMFEHQLDVHGGLNPRANRVVEDIFHQQRGKLAFPPATVYAGQQYMVPTRPPTPWKSMKELDEEAKTLHERLLDYNPFNYETTFKLFQDGYKLVKRKGWKEMQRQYHIAMEHFYSAMKFPASSRGFHDGCPSVERGRNWLTSTDREESRALHPFSLGDKVDVEPEFVLIDTKRDQEMEEMCIEISDDSDEGLSVNDKSDSYEKSFKNDDDVEMQTPDDNDFEPAKERKVFDIDSDNDNDNDNNIEQANFESHECEASSEHNVMDVESDSDSDMTVMSEVASDSDSDMTVMSEVASDTDKEKPEDSDSDSESDSSQIDDTKSASESDSGSDDEDEDNVKDSQGGCIDDTVSATESESDSDSSDSEEEHSSKGPALHEVSSSSEDSSDSEDDSSSEGPVVHEVSSSSEDSNDSDAESKVSEADSTKFVSDSECESDQEHNVSNSQDDIFNN